jgi:Zn-dependent M16 (insulinase) family peptidase
VPPGVPDIPCVKRAAAGLPLTTYTRGTNGIVYQQVIATLPSLPAELLELLPYYGNFLTEVGSAGRSYLDTQSLAAAVSGGVNA